MDAGEFCDAGSGELVLAECVSGAATGGDSA